MKEEKKAPLLQGANKVKDFTKIKIPFHHN